MTQLPYMAEPWYLLMQQAAARLSKKRLADALGVSPSTVGQVLSGGGLYGTGQASTARVAQLVVHKLGHFECPHLTERFGAPRVISADECRSYAHRATPPIGSPQALLHWRACGACPHKPLSAPAAPRVPRPPRKKASIQPQTVKEPS